MNPEHQEMSESNVGENMVRVSRKDTGATPRELTTAGTISTTTTTKKHWMRTQRIKYILMRLY